MGGDRWWWVVVAGGPWRPREATEASSCVQILTWPPKSSPLTTPPGPLKLSLRKSKSKVKFVKSFSGIVRHWFMREAFEMYLQRRMLNMSRI